METPRPSFSDTIVPDVMQMKKKKRKFSAQEDQMLTELVARFGENDWKMISLCMQDRTGASIP